MYCTVDDIKMTIPERELINLTQDNPAQNQSVDTVLLEQIITLSGEVIDGYLRSRYTLPLASTPDLIKSLAIDIVVYRLYSRRPTKINDTVKDNYKEALNQLLQVQKGLLMLALDVNNIQVELRTNLIRTNKRREDKKFTDNYLSGMP